MRKYTIDRDLAWFKKNLAKLYQQYPNKYLVVRNRRVLGAFDDVPSAVNGTVLPLGQFLLRQCLKDENAYVIHLHTPGLVSL